MPVTTLATVLLAAAAPPAAEQAALNAAVAAIYQPYTRSGEPAAAWERPIYSARTRALIARWDRVRPSDEVDDLSGADWLCMCQDWNAQRFRATIRSRRFTGATTAVVVVRVNVGFDGPNTVNDARLSFKLENGAWKIDNIFVRGDPPGGLLQSLRETIADDTRR